MATEQIPTIHVDGAPREVDRIRDIIFGPQMRDYQQRFQLLQRDIERLKQELQTLNEQLATQDGEQNKKTQSLRREARQADDDLRTELRQTTENLMNVKVDRITLGELFIELGNNLKTGGALTNLLDRLNEDHQHDARPDQG